MSSAVLSEAEPLVKLGINFIEGLRTGGAGVRSTHVTQDPLPEIKYHRELGKFFTS
jgi:hypothetical protein